MSEPTECSYISGKKLTAFTLAIFCLFAQNLHAGTRDGGGGDAVVCPTSTGQQTAQILDYVEAEETMGLTLDLGTGATYLEKVHYVLDRLEKLDPIAAQHYRARANTFVQEAAFLNRSQIKDIDDSMEIIDPKLGCKKLQFAVQNLNPKIYEKRYLIDKEIWNYADTTQQAGLVLHEIILKDAYSTYQQTNSKKARYYNGVVSSSAFNTITPRNYVSLIYAAGFVKGGRSHSVLLGPAVLTRPSVYPKTEMISGYAENDFQFSLNDGQVLQFSRSVYSDNGLSLISFDGHSTVCSTLKANTVVKINNNMLSLSSQGQTCVLNGNVSRGTVSATTPYTAPNGSTVTIDSRCSKGWGTEFELFEDGSLSKGPIAGKYTLVDAKSKKQIQLKETNYVELNRNGELVSFEKCRN